jgi:hypothetical protein
MDRRIHRLLSILALACGLALLPGLVLAQEAPSKPVVSGPMDLSWFEGNWKVSYEDAALGTVTGRARVSSTNTEGLGGSSHRVEVDLVNPRTGGTHRLQGYRVTFDGTRIEIRFEGKSPPSGQLAAGDPVPVPVEGAQPLAIPIGATVHARLDGAEASAPAVADEVPDYLGNLTLVLDVPAEGDIEGITGTWEYTLNNPREMRLSRAGAYDEGKRIVTGSESWTRPPVLVEVVTTLSEPGPSDWRAAAADPKNPLAANAKAAREKYGEDALGFVWLSIGGKDLPVQPRRAVAFTIEDPKVSFTGDYRRNPRQPRALDVQVLLRSGIENTPKPATLNTSPGLWLPDLPGLEPLLVRFVRRVREGEFENAATLYPGEIFHIEAVYPEPPFADGQNFRIVVLPKDGAPPAAEPTAEGAEGAEPETLQIDFPMMRSGTEGETIVYRSGRLLLLEPGTEAPAAGDVGGKMESDSGAMAADALIVRAAIEDRLQAAELDAAAPPGPKTSAIASVGTGPQSLWKIALARADGCRASGSDTEVTNYIVTELVTGGNLKQKVRVTREDHAAAILARDEMIRSLDSYAESLNAANPVDVTQPPAEVKRQQALWRRAESQEAMAIAEAAWNGRPHPLFNYKVSGPDGEADLYTLDAAISWHTFFFRFHRDKAQFLAYARRAISQAKGAMLGRVSDSLAKAKSIDECDVVEMMKLIGNGTKPILRALAPKLMRPARPDEAAYPAWVADDEARAAVVSVDAVASAIAAQQEYSKLDTDAVIAAVTLPFLAGGAVAGVAGYMSEGAAVYLANSAAFATFMNVGGNVMMATNLYDLYTAGRDTAAYVESSEDADFALGLSGIAGNERLRASQAQARADLMGVAMGAGLAVGGGAIEFAPNANLVDFADYRVTPAVADSVAHSAAAVGVDSLPPRDRALFDRIAEDARVTPAGERSDSQSAIVAMADAHAAGKPTGPVGDAAPRVETGTPANDAPTTSDPISDPVSTDPGDGLPPPNPANPTNSDAGGGTTEFNLPPRIETQDPNATAPDSPGPVATPATPPSNSSSSAGMTGALENPNAASSAGTNTANANNAGTNASGSGNAADPNLSHTDVDLERLRRAIIGDDPSASTTGAAEPPPSWSEINRQFDESDLANSYDPALNVPNTPNTGRGGYEYQPGDVDRVREFIETNGIGGAGNSGRVAEFWRAAGVKPDSVIAGHNFMRDMNPATSGLPPDQFRSSLDEYLNLHEGITDPGRRAAAIDAYMNRHNFGDNAGATTIVDSGGTTVNAAPDNAGVTTIVDSGGTTMNAAPSNAGGTTVVDSGGTTMNAAAGDMSSSTIADTGNATATIDPTVVPMSPGDVGRGGYLYQPGDATRLADFLASIGVASPGNIPRVTEFWRRMGLEPEAVMAGMCFSRRLDPNRADLDPDTFRRELDRFLAVNEGITDPARRAQLIDDYLGGQSNAVATNNSPPSNPPPSNQPPSNTPPLASTQPAPLPSAQPATPGPVTPRLSEPDLPPSPGPVTPRLSEPDLPPSPGPVTPRLSEPDLPSSTARLSEPDLPNSGARSEFLPPPDIPPTPRPANDNAALAANDNSPRLVDDPDFDPIAALDELPSFHPFGSPANSNASSSSASANAASGSDPNAFFIDLDSSSASPALAPGPALAPNAALAPNTLVPSTITNSPISSNADGSWQMGDQALARDPAGMVNPVSPPPYGANHPNPGWQKAPGAFADVRRLTNPDGTRSGYVEKTYGERRSWWRTNAKRQNCPPQPCWELGEPLSPRDAREMVEDTVHGAALLEAADVPVLEVLSFDVSGHPPRLVQRELGQNMPRTADGQVVDEAFAADLMVGGKFPPDLEDAIAAMMKRMADRGIFWEDAHAGNIFFQRVERDDGSTFWRAGVSDSDRIDSFANPRPNRQPEAFLREYETGQFAGNVQSRAPGAFASAEEATLAIMEAKGYLRFIQQPGKPGYFTGGYLSLQAIKRHFPGMRVFPGRSSFLWPGNLNDPRHGPGMIQDPAAPPDWLRHRNMGALEPATENLRRAA